MELEIYDLELRVSHFGRHGRGQESCAATFSSDSFFSALASVAAQALSEEAFNDWIGPFIAGTPPYIFTSAFPRAGAVRFFPKPMIPTRSAPASDGDLPLKRIRKIAFVSEGVFRKMISGVPLREAARNGELLQDGVLLVSKDEFSRLPVPVQERRIVWAMTKRPRVTIARDQSSTELFFLAETRFMSDCGLWVGVQYFSPDKTVERGRLEALLRESGEAGIGAERSIGLGHFEARRQAPIAFNPDLTVGDRFVTLSRMIPRADEIEGLQDDSSAYAIESVGGWVFSPGRAAERRRTIRMLGEGAFLKLSAPGPIGTIVDVQPDYGGARPAGHPVWRAGYAVGVRCAPPAGGDEK